MTAVPLPPCDGQRLQQRLYDEFTIEVPIITWNDRQLVRVSLQAYNTRGDMEALVRALQVLLRQ